MILLNVTHEDMMLIIQGLRLVNGMDQLNRNYSPTPEDQMAATALLIRIDQDAL